MAPTWSNNENVTESSAGIDDGRTFWHNLWSSLSLKGLSGNNWFLTSPFTAAVKCNCLCTHTVDRERDLPACLLLLSPSPFRLWPEIVRKTNALDRLLCNRRIMKTPPLFRDDTYWDSFSFLWWTPTSSGFMETCKENASFFQINWSHSLFESKPVNIFTQKSRCVSKFTLSDFF